jgi:putative membrane-bound dehydrogenase-like protein
MSVVATVGRRAGRLTPAIVAAAVLLMPVAAHVQAPDSAALVRLTPADAVAGAREARAAAPVTLADGLELSLWASGQLVTNPLTLDIDARGTAYVVSSFRSGMTLDIRGHADWVPEVHALRSTEDLRQFFRRVMAPGRSEANAWLPDQNHDGSRDWRDLMVVRDRVYRLRDTNGDGVADESLVAYEGFNDDVASDIAGGVMAYRGDVYVTAAPDLWKLHDTDGDGVFDEKTSLSHGYSTHPAFSGHDMSAITVGPDGRFYWKVGDIGMNVTDPSGRAWVYPNQGAVLRANPDGSDFEVFATGLRNPQEIAFDEHGNMIGVDNDGDHPGETERVVYITEGADAGWRSTWQYGKYTDAANNGYNVWMDEGLFRPRFTDQAAYITPPIAPYHPGPSGLAYNPGTALAPRWRNHFFVTSFTGSSATARVYAFQLAEHGAGFDLASDTEIARGVLSPGLRIGPDGAMYLTDWIRGWGASGDGRIWKLDEPAEANSPVRREVRALLTDDLTTRPVDDLRARLAHADMRVRQQAQFELVRRRDEATLTDVARTSDAPLARIHAIWGLAQLVRAGQAPGASLTPFLADPDDEIRAQAAKMLGDARQADAAILLLPLLDDEAPRARFFAAEALGRLAYAPAMPAIVSMLAEDEGRDVYLRQAGITALARLGDRTGLAALATHASRGVRLAAVVALRRLADPGVARFLDDRELAVVVEAARAINDEGGIAAAVPALARVLDQPFLTSPPLVRRALSANLRVGTADAVARVAAFAGRRNAPEALRVEAIAVLGVWAAPSTLDRVDGAYLGPAQTRDASAARAAVERLAPRLDEAGSTAAVRIALIDAAARIDATSVGTALLTRLQHDGEPAVRVAALRALQQLDVPQTAAAVRVALADDSPTVRMAAIDAMAVMPIPSADKVRFLDAVTASGSTGEQQRAIAALGLLKTPAAAQTLARLLDALVAGQIAPGVQLDVVEAARATGDDGLQSRLDRAGVGRALEHLATVFPEALANGGDARRGGQIVTEHPAAQCARCHAMGDSVSTVGPNLDRIGSALPRAELLRALLDPGARISPGFGAVSVTLTDGRTLEGMLLEESAAGLLIDDAALGRQHVVPAAIARRTNAPSAMPPMGTLLTPREIRDVVEYLTTRR